jgi:calcineurin-like phosphoesterase family protein
MSNIWFTADTHFGHKKIIEFCKRPYETVEDMNEDLIKKWNEVVGVHDDIYHLGDFAFMNKAATQDVIRRLNGRKILIMGNHDYHRKPEFFLEAGFFHVDKLKNEEIIPFWHENKIVFCLSHYPYQHVMGEYDQRDWLVPCAPRLEYVGTPLVHGHVHQQWKSQANMVNVGCDVWDLYPVSFEDLLREVNHVRDIAD